MKTDKKRETRRIALVVLLRTLDTHHSKQTEDIHQRLDIHHTLDEQTANTITYL